MKALRDAYDDYDTAIMNTNKLKDRTMFLFEFSEPDGSKLVRFHIYDVNKEYNYRYITSPFYIGRRHVIDIEKCDLHAFDENSLFEFGGGATAKQIAIFENSITRDNHSADIGLKYRIHLDD